MYYDLLQADKESVKHWFYQLGLLRKITLPDLKKLSKEKPGERSGDSVMDFAGKHEVIFAALIAVFGLMPSNSRLAEQTHGGLRDSLKEFVSLLCTDAMRAYIMNEEYHAREARRLQASERDAKRKRESGEIASDGQPPRRRRKKKHDEHKAEQQMCALQLLESGKRYKSEVTKAQIPADTLKAIGVKQVKKRGSLHMEKDLAKAKAEIATKQLSRRKTVPLTLAQWKVKAAETKAGNDETWEEHDQMKADRLGDLQRLGTVTLWNSLTLVAGFKRVMKDTLPYLWNDTMDAGMVTKKELMTLIRDHLKLLHEIAHKKTENTLSSVDVSRLQPEAVLELFIKVDNTNYFSNEHNKVQARKQRTVTVLASCGTVPSEKYSLPTSPSPQSGSDDIEEEEMMDKLE